MSFNSVEYILFFLAVSSLSFVVPGRGRTALLLAAGCVFYMAWLPSYIFLMAGITAVTYLAGLGMDGRFTPPVRNFSFWAGISANLGLLAVFKYYNFALDSVNAAIGFYGLGQGTGLPALTWLAPLGISFHTFQSLAYLIDIRKGRVGPERSPLLFGLYSLFFPQLVAGPIERPSHLLPQLSKKVVFDAERVQGGLGLIAWGLFQKVAIADNLAVLVGKVYGDPQAWSGASLIVATVFFSFQILCDFSGYTDIARGSAKVLGYDLMQNFDRPYLSASVAEFWRRWHISLSSWIRDYIYIPLGGNRVPVSRWCLNIMVVFVACGLWHGAGWNFIAWGALHGGYILFGKLSSCIRDKAWALSGLAPDGLAVKAVKTAITFGLVSFAWIFFRVVNFDDAWYIATHMLTAGGGQSVFEDAPHMIFYCMLICVMLSSDALKSAAVRRAAPAYGWAGFALLCLSTFMLGLFDGPDFIYFKF